MTDERGSMTVFVMFMVPLGLVLMLAVVNVGFFLHARTKLQIAADRGIYAGAASLAHSLNRIAKGNREIYQEYEELDEWLDETSEPSEEEVNRRFDEARTRQADLVDGIQSINETMFGRAVEIAQSVIRANVSGAILTPLFVPPDEGMTEITARDEHYGSISGADMIGMLFDPTSYDVEEPRIMLKYLEKNSAAQVLFGGLVEASSPVPVFPDFFGGGRTMQALAVAQPFGGSLIEFARTGTEAEHLYQVTALPSEMAVNDE